MGRRTRKRTTKRPPRVEGDYVVIPLTKGQEAIVDMVDAELGQFNWAASRHSRWFYAVRSDGPRHAKRQIYLHQAVAERAGVQLRDDQEIDHRNGDRLDCRRSNLRAATRSQNSSNTRIRSDNTSGHKGVFWNTDERLWVASIWAQKKYKYLGGYHTFEQARDAYVNAARELHGEFACPDGRAA